MRNRKISLISYNVFGNFSIWPIVLIGLILRLVNINAPVLGIHSWRQADTASIARNFLANNLNFWEPQVNWSGSTNGFVECEFPLYQYIVANLYKLFGINEVFARGVSVLFGILSLVFLFRLIKKVLNIQVAWWGTLFYSMLPISVFYSRTIQPESLMMFLGILSLERWYKFIESKDSRILLISWFSFTLAVLIKVLPFFWIGIPILISAYQKSLILKYKLYVYPLLTILICFFWYSYAYRLGQTTGLTFGLWGSDTDRYSWLILLEIRFYIDLFFRIIFRNFLLIGFLPILFSISITGLRNVFVIGIFSVLLTGLINPSSFGIHEYYQLPLMIFISPLMGLGFVQLKSYFFRKKLLIYSFLGLLFAASLVMLKVDYWDLEIPSRQPVWNTSELIKQNTKKSDLIISITGGDPTLLYLSNRKGWLISPKQIDQNKIEELIKDGAKYIAGSWEVIESYQKFDDSRVKTNLIKLICNFPYSVENSENKCKKLEKSYLIKLT